MSRTPGTDSPSDDVPTDLLAYIGDYPKLETESWHGYRQRVSGILREDFRLIEAHEVMSGHRYEEGMLGDNGKLGRIGTPGNPLTGVFGAIINEGEGGLKAKDGLHQVGDDIAMGVVQSAPKDPMQAMVEQFGPGIIGLFLGGR
jgi:hypothetical protein